ncbi:MAG: Do family serine endopeptidase [Planctomycetota bacterium]|nr:Do family serine endopeptidase [Planctomycetota bacterium]
MNQTQNRFNKSTRLRSLLVAAGVLSLGGFSMMQSSQIPGPSVAYSQQAAIAEVSATALNNKAIASADQLSSAFRDVAKTLRPAVVSIQAVAESKPAARVRGGRGGQPQLPPGIPPEFRQFFGGDVFPFQMPGEDEGAPLQGPQGRRSSGLGSGVIVSPNGYILTNNHVVEGASKLEVRLSDDRKFEAKVVGTDPKIDIAVLKIEASGLVPARIGDSAGAEVGDWVIAIGSPFGLNQTVTSGIISATHREEVGITQYDDFLQTDAAINPGNSGGPLLNLRGEIIGINTAIASQGGGFNGIGFAIPSNTANSVLQSILKNGKVVRGFIGTQMMTEERAEELGLPKLTEGVYIESVAAGGPAEKGGIKPGDIVQSIDGEKMTSLSKLRRHVATLSPGNTASFEILRDGKLVTLKVTIEEQTDEKLAQLATKGGAEALGITVEPISPEIAADFGLEANAVGVVVKEVNSQSPAANALQPGEIILEVNGIKISSAEEFKAAANKGKGVVRLLVRNATSTRMVIVK